MDSGPVGDGGAGHGIMTTVSTKPYFIRALYEWCVDQGFTPHLAVNVDDRVVVPPGYARDGQIVLNIGGDATQNLLIDNESITFQARFGGVPHSLYIPIGSVLAIYARENGHGMAFELDTRGRDDEDADSGGAVLAAVESAADETSREESAGEKVTETDGSDDPSPPKRGHLKVVK